MASFGAQESQRLAVHPCAGDLECPCTLHGWSSFPHALMLPGRGCALRHADCTNPGAAKGQGPTTPESGAHHARVKNTYTQISGAHHPSIRSNQPKSQERTTQGSGAYNPRARNTSKDEEDPHKDLADL